MTENLHGKYSEAITYLKDVADGGERKRTEAKEATDKLLALGHHAPRQQPKYSDPLTREMLKSTGS